jgi:outer membrane protein insertion porin family
MQMQPMWMQQPRQSQPMQTQPMQSPSMHSQPMQTQPMQSPSMQTQPMQMQHTSTSGPVGSRSPAMPSGNQPASMSPSSAPRMIGQTTFYRSQSPQDGDTIQIPTGYGEGNSVVQPTAVQFPDTGGGLPASPGPVSTIPPDAFDVGSPVYPPTVQNDPNASPIINYADLDIYVSETETGRINLGGAFNSESGLVGQFVIDERNFDILRFPRGFRDIVDGTAWRGGGQTFRLELVPGNEVQRYLVSFSEPFLFNSPVSLSTSLYYFQRQFFDFDEQRLGGRFAFGYRLGPDLSISAGLRMEDVKLYDPRNMNSPTLNDSLGSTDLFLGNVSLIRDTRDHPFLPTQGNFLSMTYSQGFGEVDFPRGDIDFRTYRLMYERPDGSGRHTLSYGTKLGFSGSQTPIFENYFAGGFSTLRGFDFRGASPVEGDIRVGGTFQWLNTVEYMFPLTADDMIKAVVFTDFGTVEEDIEINSDNFRVAPGFGFRVHMPAAGIGAPLAFDFAFPVAKADGDEEQVFSFYLGVAR